MTRDIERGMEAGFFRYEASVGQVLKAGLAMHGFTVRYEARSTDTIQACLEFHPDLVFLDIDMPVKDAGWWRRSCRTIRRCGATAFSKEIAS